MQKIHSLYLLKSGKVKTVTHVAVCVGVHRVTIQKWLKKYQERGLAELLKIPAQTGRPSKLNSSALAQLEARLNEAENGFKSYYRGAKQPFKKVTFTQVLEGEIPADLFKNKIVLIGSRAISLKDYF